MMCAERTNVNMGDKTKYVNQWIKYNLSGGGNQSIDSTTNRCLQQPQTLQQLTKGQYSNCSQSCPNEEWRPRPQRISSCKQYSSLSTEDVRCPSEGRHSRRHVVPHCNEQFSSLATEDVHFPNETGYSRTQRVPRCSSVSMSCDVRCRDGAAQHTRVSDKLRERNARLLRDLEIANDLKRAHEERIQLYTESTALQQGNRRTYDMHLPSTSYHNKLDLKSPRNPKRMQQQPLQSNPPSTPSLFQQQYTKERFNLVHGFSEISLHQGSQQNEQINSSLNSFNSVNSDYDDDWYCGNMTVVARGKSPSSAPF